jgi:hypothetical protein
MTKIPAKTAKHIATLYNSVIVAREMQKTSEHPQAWFNSEAIAVQELLDMGIPVVGSEHILALYKPAK